MKGAGVFGELQVDEVEDSEPHRFLGLKVINERTPQVSGNEW